MTAKLLLIRSENGLETRQDYDGLPTDNPSFTGGLKQGAITRVTAGGGAWFASLQATNLVGAGDRPIAADLTGTIQPKTPDQFRNMIFALASSLKGAANGVAELGADGRVPTAQLPSYVDDVLEYASFAALPATGETGKIYISQDDNKTWRWSGSAYVEISASLALGETSATAYRGDRGKTAYDHSQATGNPHGTTAADVGALAKITLTGAIDSHAINGGAPGLYELRGSSYVNFPGALLAASGGTLLQTVGNNGRILQELHSELTGKMIQRQTGPSTWSGWTTIWDNDILPVSMTGLAVVSAASQFSARSAIAAAASTGVTDGSNAGAGVVGQYYEALLPEASQVSPSNGVPISVLSLSLPAGDWLVEGRATAAITGAMAGNEVVSGLNTSVAIPTDGTEIYGGMQVFSATNGFQTMTGSKRFSLASTATIHLVGRISFSAGTPGLFGCMSARRMR